MKKIISILLCVAGLLSTAYAQSWHSSLYPEDWTPGYQDDQGRFLHDFSYAGYHTGLDDIPNIQHNIIDITKSPYNANNKGKVDVTAIMQQAIDSLAKIGGGVLYIPRGEYLMSIDADKKQGLKISSDNIVIRGAGANKTFLKNSSTSIRLKNFIAFEPNGGAWTKPTSKVVEITKDFLRPTKQLEVSDASVFEVGDVVMITSDCTKEYVVEHLSEGYWAENSIRTAHFCRKVTKVDHRNNIVEIDIPTRYFLKRRDNPVIYKIGNQLKECGIEYLSVGNVQHPALASSKKDWDKDAYLKKGTGAYDIHQSHLIHFDRSMDCWVRGMSTYCTKGNPEGFHFTANCLYIGASRTITVEDCDFRHSQYEGAGGNGYMYTLSANDCLIQDCYAENGRHHYDFKSSLSSGNVILNCTGKDSFLPSDFHMHLSIANLFDSFTADGDYIDAKFRLAGTAPRMHSYSATECVMWNTKGKKPHSKVKDLVVSNQFRWGYIIGTSGKVSSVKTSPVEGSTISRDWRTLNMVVKYDGSPEDFTEGIGRGETLEPQSLYLDQLAKRKERIKHNNNN